MNGLIPSKRYRHRGMGRYLVVMDTQWGHDIYRGAQTYEGACKARREVSHWPNAYIYDQATDAKAVMA
jgi:hypothetical protein